MRHACVAALSLYLSLSPVAAEPAAADARASAAEELDEVMRSVPDPMRGEGLARLCATCHGQQGSGLPGGWVPMIAGQHARVIEKELIDYRHGLRWDARMETVASPHLLGSVQDIADVASYVASLAPEPPVAVGGGEQLEGGRNLYERLCRSCHGAQAEGSNLHRVPRLAGQRFEYLLRQMHDVVDGRRPNMRAQHVRIVAPLTRAQLTGLADYLTRMGLKGPQHGAHPVAMPDTDSAADGQP